MVQFSVKLLMYKENLPANCPTADSHDAELEDVWRFLRGPDASAACFESHATQGKQVREGFDPCKWSSCSLFVGDSHTAAMLKLPRFKSFKARAELSIPQGSGVSLQKDEHIDFWAYDHFDFLSAIVRIEPK